MEAGVEIPLFPIALCCTLMKAIGEGYMTQ